jgi:nucleoside phosphorylase
MLSAAPISYLIRLFHFSLHSHNQVRAMSDPKNYTVGWICALSTEQIAAAEFLDVEHEPLEDQPVHDFNSYILGSIGKHNVVIAVLPLEYGTAPAANVATNLIRTFPNIRVGLLVGIGGGAPSEEHDIRLGDVVVSAPSGSDGGIFQYDFGKTVQQGAFQRTGHLNKPPPVLRSAVATLQTRYKRRGHQFKANIDAILEKNERLVNEFRRPEPSSDLLFLPSVVHKEGKCAVECAKEDKSNLVQRRNRTQHENDPAIHYGLIASANQVMKDALSRDKLSKERDVLCFEMEAAGLINNFPCLVIRGICDYADSHKNDEWQGFAAMAAAAYAKDLLGLIPPSKIEAEQKISVVITQGYPPPYSKN